jgi:hypothetical protein
VINADPFGSDAFMQDYKLFWIDGPRPVMRMDDFKARSDREALSIARGLERKANCQLWNGDRLVATVRLREATPA